MEFGDIGLSAADTAQADVPVQYDTLPDGTPSVMYGDVTGYAEYNHQQGDNPYGFQEDCGLVSSADVLNQFGIPATESDVVEHAAANGECDIDYSDLSNSGGTSLADQAKILGDYGVPSHAETGQSLEGLASQVEQGHGVIAEVNAGYLWGDSNYVQNGYPNHAITVTGVARDPSTGQIQGFYINDSGTGQSAEFVPAATMQQAWASTGGAAVVTDAVHTQAQD